jgi:hypothetical protein
VKQQLLNALFLLTLAGQATAESTVFKTRDANGNAVFSDQAGADAEEISVQTPQTFEAAPPSRFQLNNEPEEVADLGPAYDRLEITSPENDSAFRNNAGNVTVQVILSPALQQNHSIQLVLDGKVMDTKKTVSPFLLQNLDRGTHTFTAQVIEDETGDVLIASVPVVSTLLRVSIIRRTN